MGGMLLKRGELLPLAPLGGMRTVNVLPHWLGFCKLTMVEFLQQRWWLNTYPLARGCSVIT